MASGGGAAPDVPDCYPPPRVGVTLAEVTVVGPVSQDDARRALRRIASSLENGLRAAAAGVSRLSTDRCEGWRYEQMFSACPAVEPGEVAVQLRVAPDGSVQSAGVQGAAGLGGGRGEFEGSLRSMRFPSADEGSQVTAIWEIKPGR